MSGPLLSAPLLGGRVLELAREIHGRSWRLTVTQIDGKDRRYDEGEEFWPKRYAILGRLVAHERRQVGYCIIDSKAIGRFMSPVFPGITAQTLPELARKLELDEAGFMKTLNDYNAACRVGNFDHRCSTTPHGGLVPGRLTGRGRSTRHRSTATH